MRNRGGNGVWTMNMAVSRDWISENRRRLNAVTRGLRPCGVPRFDGDSARTFSIEIVFAKINK